MPLTKSSSDKAFKSNLKAEMAAGRPQKQALAIAYRVQRDAKAKKMAKGGRVGYAPGGSIPFYARSQARGMERPAGGIIASAVPGRSDKIPMSPKGGSYVIPADVTSSIGQGNSIAGAKGLTKLFGMQPYGAGAAPKIPTPRRPRLTKFADGGAVNNEPVDIMAAGGEFLVPPEKVAEIGNGDVERGHAILDSFVAQTRKKTVKTLKNLPGPRDA